MRDLSDYVNASKRELDNKIAQTSQALEKAAADMTAMAEQLKQDPPPKYEQPRSKPDQRSAGKKSKPKKREADFGVDEYDITDYKNLEKEIDSIEADFLEGAELPPKSQQPPPPPKENANKDRILELTEKGMHASDIAKKLSIGVTEVQIIQDLLKGA